MRCGASDEKRDAATGQKNPAFGGPERLIGLRCGACPMTHIALRAALARMSRSGPSNDPVRSEDALERRRLHPERLWLLIWTSVDRTGFIIHTMTLNNRRGVCRNDN